MAEEQSQLSSMLEMESLGEFVGSVLKPAGVGNCPPPPKSTSGDNPEENQIKKVEYFDTTSWPTRCQLGIRQSPINIQAPFYPDPNAVLMALVVPQGNKIKLSFDGYKIIAEATFGTLQYGAHPFLAKEIYMRHPSEHTVSLNNLVRL